SDEIVAWPVDETTLRPNGGYYSLISADSGDVFRNDVWIGDIDGTLYAIYTVRDSDGNNSLALAKESSTAATVVAPQWPVNSDGSLSAPTGNVNLLTWDAASDDLPDDFTITASSGSNQSQHVDGSYYEFKTGSGSSQDLRLQSVARF